MHPRSHSRDTILKETFKQWHLNSSNPFQWTSRSRSPQDQILSRDTTRRSLFRNLITPKRNNPSLSLGHTKIRSHESTISWGQQVELKKRKWEKKRGRRLVERNAATRNRSENNIRQQLTVTNRGGMLAKMAVTSNRERVRRPTGQVEEAKVQKERMSATRRT